MDGTEFVGNVDITDTLVTIVVAPHYYVFHMPTLTCQYMFHASQHVLIGSLQFSCFFLEHACIMNTVFWSVTLCSLERA
jgi:hypothetical protein